MLLPDYVQKLNCTDFNQVRAEALGVPNSKILLLAPPRVLEVLEWHRRARVPLGPAPAVHSC